MLQLHTLWFVVIAFFWADEPDDLMSPVLHAIELLAPALPELLGLVLLSDPQAARASAPATVATATAARRPLRVRFTGVRPFLWGDRSRRRDRRALVC